MLRGDSDGKGGGGGGEKRWVAVEGMAKVVQLVAEEMGIEGKG